MKTKNRKLLKNDWNSKAYWNLYKGKIAAATKVKAKSFEYED